MGELGHRRDHQHEAHGRGVAAVEPGDLEQERVDHHVSGDPQGHPDQQEHEQYPRATRERGGLGERRDGDAVGSGADGVVSPRSGHRSSVGRSRRAPQHEGHGCEDEQRAGHDQHEEQGLLRRRGDQRADSEGKQGEGEGTGGAGDAEVHAVAERERGHADGVDDRLEDEGQRHEQAVQDRDQEAAAQGKERRREDDEGDAAHRQPQPQGHLRPVDDARENGLHHRRHRARNGHHHADLGVAQAVRQQVDAGEVHDQADRSPVRRLEGRVTGSEHDRHPFTGSGTRH